jgi:hypothetical protein
MTQQQPKSENDVIEASIKRLTRLHKEYLT